MKLYRGIKCEEITFLTEEVKNEINSVIGSLLQLRQSGDFHYPEKMNGEIIKSRQLLRLRDQYFTDRKDIAEDYAKSENGLLLEMDVPPEDILEFFKVEFQDFGKRKEDFQLVYRVDGEILLKNRDTWNVKQTKISHN